MVPQGSSGASFPYRRDEPVRKPDGDGIFYRYYQISRSGEPDEAETEPKKEGELRTEFEGSHSPFGFIWNIASATGWSVKYILEKVNYQTLILMLSDAPRYVRRRVSSRDGQPDGEVDESSAAKEAGDIVNFFQSKLEL